MTDKEMKILQELIDYYSLLAKYSTNEQDYDIYNILLKVKEIVSNDSN